MPPIVNCSLGTIIRIKMHSFNINQSTPSCPCSHTEIAPCLQPACSPGWTPLHGGAKSRTYPPPPKKKKVPTLSLLADPHQGPINHNCNSSGRRSQYRPPNILNKARESWENWGWLRPHLCTLARRLRVGSEVQQQQQEDQYWAWEEKDWGAYLEITKIVSTIAIICSTDGSISRLNTNLSTITTGTAIINSIVNRGTLVIVHGFLTLKHRRLSFFHSIHTEPRPTA